MFCLRDNSFIVLLEIVKKDMINRRVAECMILDRIKGEKKRTHLTESN